MDSIVPDAEELARALASKKGKVRGGRGKRSRAEETDASALPQESRLKGKLDFSKEGAGTIMADYDDLYREIAREYYRCVARSRDE